MVLSMRLVALNNLAAIQEDSSSRSEDASAQIAKQLQAALIQASTDGTFFSEVDMQRFALNVMLWGASPRNAAAA
jgi:hypothetical protein